jgi:hypothetical protein
VGDVAAFLVQLVILEKLQRHNNENLCRFVF